MSLRKVLTAAVLCASVALSACDNAEQRAEKYYQSGMTYLAQGDVDRALIEFRNVFKLNGKHREARIAYAEAERKRGNLREAYSQYLRLIEQYPDDIDGLRALATIATENGQWADAAPYIATALSQKPDDPGFKSLKVYDDYGLAVQNNNAAAVEANVKAARDLLLQDPKDILAYKVVIDGLINKQMLDDALKELDAAIAIAPKEQILYAQRLSVYAAQGNDAAVESSLVDMVKMFPEVSAIQDGLLRWYLSRKEYDKAEAFLRSRIDPSSDDAGPEIALIRFLGQYRGPDAAIAELDTVIASGKNSAVFRSARAGFEFDRGDRKAAIDEMQAIIKSGDANPEDMRTIKVGLARMQLSVGNSVAARALVEDVLSDDSGQVEAVKLKATWLIYDDQTGDAITLLRSAIQQNPRDAGLMTLLAQAYEREGSHDLMGQMLGQAVDASGHAPEESVRYAQFLVADGKLPAAEGTLIDALRLAPRDPSILVPLGQVYLAMKDWSRADGVVTALEELNDPAIAGAIQNLRVAILSGQQKPEEASSYLEQLATSKDAQLDAKVAVIRDKLQKGQNDEALGYSKELLASDPGNLDLQFVNATVLASVGQMKQAEDAFRAIVAKDPKRVPVWMSLIRLASLDPARKAETGAIVDQALAANPDAGELLWAKAGLLEGSGDIDGAIAIYDGLYKGNSANPVIANNLASLLSNYRTDADSLKRAEVIARRLRGSEVPAYQDTYGWIAYQNKNLSDAVPELEKAAAALKDDPSVQYHLAMAYLAAGRQADAKTQFDKVMSLVQPGDSRSFVVDTKSQLDKLNAAGVAN